MSTDAFILFDEKLKVHAFHQQIFEILDIPSGDNPPQKIQQHLQNHPELYQWIKQLLLKSENKTTAHFRLNKDKGRSEPVQVTAFITQTAEGNRRIFTYFCKLTESSENYIPRMRSMKYNVISKLAPSIAHEIRNPLSSLAIHTEILDNTLPALSLQSEQYQRIKKSITVLQSELERVMKIIDRFFKLARSAAKESSYEDVNSILRETVELIKPQCYEQGIKIEINLEKNIPFVYLNRDELIQVLLNIMINAMESLSEGGVLTILSKKDDDKSVVIIQDNGKGISPSDLNKIFTANFSNKDNGSGMSLVLSRQIIEKMGGKITVESDPHRGTSFIIILPKAGKF